MSSQRKDLSTTDAEPDPSIDFSANDLLDYIRVNFNYPARQPGEYTAKEIAGKLGRSYKTIGGILTRLIGEGIVGEGHRAFLEDGSIKYVYALKDMIKDGKSIG